MVKKRNRGITFKKGGRFPATGGPRHHRQRGWTCRPYCWNLRTHTEPFHPDPRGGAGGRPARMAIPHEVRVRLSKLHWNRGRGPWADVRGACTCERVRNPRRRDRGTRERREELVPRDDEQGNVRGTHDHPRDRERAVQPPAPRDPRRGGIRGKWRALPRAGPSGFQEQTGPCRWRRGQGARERARGGRGGGGGGAWP